VEAVLRERVHALEAKSVQQVAAMLQEAPPGKVGLFLTDLPAGAGETCRVPCDCPRRFTVPEVLQWCDAPRTFLRLPG